MKIMKRSGNIVVYDDEKIVGSILRANGETEENLSPKTASYIADAVLGRLVKEHDYITTKLIREGVSDALREMDLPMTAKRYLEYSKDE